MKPSLALAPKPSPWQFAWQPSASLALSSAALAALYGLCNHLTSLRPDVGLHLGGGVFGWETASTMPFVPWTVLPYLSIAIFFVASYFVDGRREGLKCHVLRLGLVLGLSLLCWALCPLRFTFERPPVPGALGVLFDLLTAVDRPYNRAPSLHISLLVLLWARLVPQLNGRWRLLLQGWFVLIGVSVLTTYQHHLIDIPAGLLLGAVCIGLAPLPIRRGHCGRAGGSGLVRACDGVRRHAAAD